MPYLTPAQLSLFRQMQPSEQVHAYQIFKHLETAGQTNPDLLAAALLHDVGKILYPLSIFDRVIIVLGKRLFPERRKALGCRDATRAAPAIRGGCNSMPGGVRTWHPRRAPVPGAWN